MNERLQRVLRKAEWAQAHTVRLDRAIREFLDPSPYSLGRRQENHGRDHVIYVETVRQPPDDIGLIVGDVAHAARTSLDHLAYALARTPNIETAFPIWDAPRRYRNGKQASLTIAGGVPARVKKLLREVQPYYDGRDPRFSRLSALRELDNIDKHRLVLTVTASHTGSVHGFIGDEPSCPWELLPEWGPLKPGEEIARFVFADPQPEREVEFDILPEVAVEGVHPLIDGENIIGQFMGMIQEVREVCERFTDYLRR